MPPKGVRYLVVILTSLLLVPDASALPAPLPEPSPIDRVSSGSKKASVSGKKRAGRKMAGRSARRRSRRASVRGQAAPTPQRIQEIQQALARSGHYDQPPSGKLDANTAAALAAFQEAQGLERSGKLDAWTLKKLEQFGLPTNSRASAAKPPPAEP